jgi:hypothetical protein
VFCSYPRLEPSEGQGLLDFFVFNCQCGGTPFKGERKGKEGLRVVYPVQTRERRKGGEDYYLKFMF